MWVREHVPRTTHYRSLRSQSPNLTDQLNHKEHLLKTDSRSFLQTSWITISRSIIWESIFSKNLLGDALTCWGWKPLPSLLPDLKVSLVGYSHRENIFEADLGLWDGSVALSASLVNSASTFLCSLFPLYLLTFLTQLSGRTELGELERPGLAWLTRLISY